MGMSWCGLGCTGFKCINTTQDLHRQILLFQTALHSLTCDWWPLQAGVSAIVSWSLVANDLTHSNTWHYIFQRFSHFHPWTATGKSWKQIYLLLLYLYLFDGNSIDSKVTCQSWMLGLTFRRVLVERLEGCNVGVPHSSDHVGPPIRALPHGLLHTNQHTTPLNTHTLPQGTN